MSLCIIVLNCKMHFSPDYFQPTFQLLITVTKWKWNIKHTMRTNATAVLEQTVEKYCLAIYFEKKKLLQICEYQQFWKKKKKSSTLPTFLCS